MQEKIQEILHDINNQECYYVGINGCLYQDLTQEKLFLIKDYINNLHDLIYNIKEIVIENIDDEFYINLTKKEKSLFKIQELLEEYYE